MLAVKVKTKTAPKPKAKKTASRKAEYVEFKNVDRAIEVALYYGFTPLQEPLTVTKEDREKAKELGEREERGGNPRCALYPVEEKVALLRLYQEKRWFERPHPIMLCFELSSSGAPKKKGGQRRLGFDMLGASGSIAEAILIQTARAILNEEGYEDTMVALNSVGDRDCGSRFVRELVNFYRKNVSDLPAPCRALLRKNPMELLECEHDKCRLLSKDAPNTIAFLSEASRKQFKEVLEYLEELAIPYRIDPLLIGNRTLSTETVFEIRDAKEEGARALLGGGLRYNLLARRLGGKKDVPSVGAVLLLQNGKGERTSRRVRIQKPSVFFLQLGFEAKLKSLKVIEVLRAHRILVYQALARDKLSSQMGSAEHLKLPYSIIMGQKEALEDSVIVRDTTTRAQETVKIAELPAYLKRLRLA